MKNLFHSPEWHSHLCARVDNALSVVILASEHLCLLDEFGEASVGLGGLAHVRDSLSQDLVEIWDKINPNREDVQWLPVVPAQKTSYSNGPLRLCGEMEFSLRRHKFYA